MAILEAPFDGVDCASGGMHYNPFLGYHSSPEDPFGHIGDMPMLASNGFYEGDLFT